MPTSQQLQPSSTNSELLAGLALAAGRAYQENVRLFGTDVARGMHDTDNSHISAVAELIESAFPFSRLNGSETTITITVNTADVSRLRAALARVGGAA